MRAAHLRVLTNRSFGPNLASCSFNSRKSWWSTTTLPTGTKHQMHAFNMDSLTQTKFRFCVCGWYWRDCLVDQCHQMDHLVLGDLVLLYALYHLCNQYLEGQEDLYCLAGLKKKREHSLFVIFCKMIWSSELNVSSSPEGHAVAHSG